MNVRNPQFAVFLAILAAGALACDEHSPTETQTVRLAIVAGAEHGGTPFNVDMTQELTQTVTGDADGTGVALITLNPGLGEVCWDLSVSNISLPATASHIHKAPAGVSGPASIFLSRPDGNGVAQACRAEVDRALLLDILRNPAAYYVNVHTTEFPAGAVRGQLP